MRPRTLTGARWAAFAALILSSCSSGSAPSETIAGTRQGLTGTFGRSTVGTEFLALSVDYKRGSPFALSDSATTLTKLTAYVDGLGAASGSQQLRGYVYANDGASGAPGTLKCITSLVTVNANAAAAWV